MISCSRTIGSTQIWLSKSCRLIAGEGVLSVPTQFRETEILTCKFPAALIEATNEKAYRIECH